MRLRMLGKIDSALHRHLDGYIDRQRPGWGLLQVWQWRVCNAYERRLDRL